MKKNAKLVQLGRVGALRKLYGSLTLDEKNAVMLEVASALEHLARTVYLENVRVTGKLERAAKVMRDEAEDLWQRTLKHQARSGVR